MRLTCGCTTTVCMGHPRIDDGDAVVIAADRMFDLHYLRAHLDPETDPIVRAICEKLDIDWRAISEES